MKEAGSAGALRRRAIVMSAAALVALVGVLVPESSWAAVAKVEGTVTDKDGNPLDGVLVTVRSEDGAATFEEQTNRRGKFSLSIRDPSGAYFVRLQKEGYDAFEEPIDVREGVKLDAEFRLLSAREGERLRAELEAIQAKNKASRLYNEGVERYNASDPDGAIEKFAEALEEDPGLAVALAGIGRLHLEQKRYEQAIEALARFEEIDPGRMAVLLMLYDAHAGAGNEDEARKTLDTLVATHPGPETAARIFNQGVAAVSGNDLARAKSLFAQVLKLAPELHPAHVNLAHIHRALGEWEEALVQVDIFLGHEPEHVRALALRYEALHELGRDAEATEALAMLQRVSPAEAAEIFHEQGIDLFNADDRAAATQSFRRALEIEPAHAHAHYMLGLCLLGAGELEEATALLRKFLEMAPEDPDAPAAREMLDSL